MCWYGIFLVRGPGSWQANQVSMTAADALICHVTSSLDSCPMEIGMQSSLWVNSLSPGRCGCYHELVIFQLVSRLNISNILCETVIKWMAQDQTDHKSTLFQVMAWCHQATSHHMSQCWPRPMVPYSITRTQRVNLHNQSCVKVENFYQMQILYFVSDKCLKVWMARNHWHNICITRPSPPNCL